MTIAIVMTVGVYGFVAAIVKLDDVGLYLARKYTGLPRMIGNGMVAFGDLYYSASVRSSVGHGYIHQLAYGLHGD